MVERNKLSELVGLAPPTVELTKEQKEENARLQKETFGGPTLFVNRHYIQIYPDSGVRLSFGEQFSPDASVPAPFRTAVFMHTPTAIQFAQILVNLLPPGSVTLPPVKEPE